MQPEGLLVLEGDTSVPVHDRLRQPRGAGAEQHVERVVERHRVEREVAGLGEQGGPVVVAGAEVADPHRVAQRRQRGFDRGDLADTIDVLGAVAVPVDREQHRRARSARSGRRPTSSRTPARRTTTPRPGSQLRERRRASRGCSARYATTAVARPHTPPLETRSAPGNRVRRAPPTRARPVRAGLAVRDHRGLVAEAVGRPAARARA